jgi:HK97 family phage major capsid protein
LFFNLGSGYRLNARWLLNTFALKVVTKLKDTTGRGLFLPDPREPGNFLIYAKPVEVFDEIAVDDVAKTTKIGFGDWKRAYYLFDRQQLAVLTTNVGGTSFTKGTVDTRVDERFDGQVADKKAAVVLTGVLVA